MQCNAMVCDVELSGSFQIDLGSVVFWAPHVYLPIYLRIYLHIYLYIRCANDYMRDDDYMRVNACS